MAHWTDAFVQIEVPANQMPEFRRLETEFIGTLRGPNHVGSEILLSLVANAAPGSSVQSG